ncbi:tRNA (adenosine(37)-N6)-dimethylallyltransferase MiaA [Spiractinospora alimapuensis]|uniref:tRNA (adenosine(37)-N6)-dimethylallyltransferase MiaA n=1 Tax=Spiractinospora alimapuensis TaxID=2820884 RepID=UPI001F01F591|nr:tRNA (adenosine(37)-N6)-dimethylallyltransferase MiaA [Spiractinospora alimapuensis]
MRRVVGVVGATTAGKSDLAVELALRLRAEGQPAEIVNADSMQLYRGMDIGTAKVTHAERRGVAHHLLGVLDVTEAADVATYQRQSRAVIDRLTSTGTVAILVGGSGLYVRAALDQLEFPGTDPDLRATLEDELAREGSQTLYDRLRLQDPEAAERILPSNGRRLVRALEVIQLTGRPFSASLPQYVYEIPAVQIGVDIPRDALDDRVERRVHRMWESGLVDEVRALERAGLRQGRTASRALGYAQVLRHLAGECSEDAAVEDTILATRRFARRQESWFRRDPRIQWVTHDRPDRVEAALEHLASPAHV